MGDVADDRVARKLHQICDFIFLAADTMLARSVVNQIAHQYLIPTLQVGSKPVIDEPQEESWMSLQSCVRLALRQDVSCVVN